MNCDWHEFYIGMAKYVSSKSKDRSTKLGAVAVNSTSMAPLSIGFNGFPRGIDDNNPSYHERPLKYAVTEHAERNVIYNCARHGIALDGSTLYMHYEPFPCSPCARGIIQSGIVRVIGNDVTFDGKGPQWTEDLQIAKNLLLEAGVELFSLRDRPGLDGEVVYYLKNRGLQPCGGCGDSDVPTGSHK